MEIHSALTAVQTLKTELQDAKMAAIDMQLKPLPGESVREI
jgi:talin